MDRLASQAAFGRDVYIAPTAYVGGDVTLGNECTVMHQVTIRADIAKIRIGHRVNIQDAAVIHTKHGVDLTIADEVGIGHRAVVHGRLVGARTLIGIGAIVLDDCEIGTECIIAAGAVVVPETIGPDRTVMMGMPARSVRRVTPADLEYMSHVVQSYLEIGRRHRRGEFPNLTPKPSLLP